MMRPRLMIPAVLTAVMGFAAAAHAQDAEASNASNEVRLGGIYSIGERNSLFNHSTLAATGNLQGFDALFRTSGIGLTVRYLEGTFSGPSGASPDVIGADANLLLGPPAFSIVGGYGRRALAGSTGNVVYSFFRAGASMTWLIGGTGFRSVINGAYYVPATASGPGTGDMDKGMEGEASLIYTFHSAPLYLQFGYRTEVFTPKSTSPTPEEVRGIRLGGGIQFGGK